MILKIL